MVLKARHEHEYFDPLIPLAHPHRLTFANGDQKPFAAMPQLRHLELRHAEVNLDRPGVRPRLHLACLPTSLTHLTLHHVQVREAD